MKDQPKIRPEWVPDAYREMQQTVAKSKSLPKNEPLNERSKDNPPNKK